MAGISSDSANEDPPAEPVVAAPAENSGSDSGDEGGHDDDTTLVLGGEDVGRVSECEAWVTNKKYHCFWVIVQV